MLERIHIIITLLATVVMAAICLINRYTLLTSAICLVVAIVAFYLFGSIIRAYAAAAIFKKADVNTDAGETAEPVETTEEGKEADIIR